MSGCGCSDKKFLINKTGVLQTTPVNMFLLALLYLAFGLSWVQADPCPSNLYLPFSLYTESMGEY